MVYPGCNELTMSCTRTYIYNEPDFAHVELVYVLARQNVLVHEIVYQSRTGYQMCTCHILVISSRHIVFTIHEVNQGMLQKLIMWCTLIWNVVSKCNGWLCGHVNYLFVWKKNWNDNLDMNLNCSVSPILIRDIFSRCDHSGWRQGNRKTHCLNNQFEDTHYFLQFWCLDVFIDVLPDHSGELDWKYILSANVLKRN